MERTSTSLLRRLSQAVFPTEWTAILWLMGALYMAVWLPKLVRTGLKHPSAQQKLSTTEGVRLERLTCDRDRSNTDIDIVAIHGLDTNSPNTWTWKSKDDKPDVNWLADSCMLPRQVERARIFACDWPASLFNPPVQAPKTLVEYTAPLLEGIRRELLEDDDLRGEPRPILFIASCLGGIILSAALVDAAKPKDHYHRIFQATRGIVFLATPFRGTSFEDVANWAEVGLRVLALIQDQKVATLIDRVKGPLSEMNKEFTKICRESPLELVSFYEGKSTSLPQKAIPWLPLPGWLRQEKLLVGEESASLDIITNSLRLNRRHSEMNKFSGPTCDDYRTVAGKIKATVAAILRETRLNQADEIIRTQRYTEAKLDIIRLSGARLQMEHCYVNLALVDQGKQDQNHGADPATEGNRFTLAARLKVQTPDKAMQVRLSSLFNDRNGKSIRRILIRGSAGVGKTTFCKKVVYDFYHGTSTELHRSWAILFDRVLWIPLRKLKEKPFYTLNKLLCHEFFSAPKKRKDLADDLAALLPKIQHRTLFLLDGLDEILPDLHSEENRFDLLEMLLGQKNVIITSRPSATLPSHLGRPDLELETTGFSPLQVKEYIEKAFTNSLNEKDRLEKVGSITSFLDQHWLLRSLVRIPIQLDALCYTWDEFSKVDLVNAPNNMTAIYTALEQKLWKKDAVRMGKRLEGTPVTAPHVASGAAALVSDEKQFLELLAFSGLHNSKLEFSPADWNQTWSHLKLQDFSPDKQLPQMSFLRGTEQELGSGPCHFIHLTFQEYFAARYFVVKWNTPGGQLVLLRQDSPETDLVSPEQYLRRYKYTARYDMFWRFVAGLLDLEYPAQVVNFLNAVEQEPLDLLGPTHQRLVMHCLSEISSQFQLRRGLERRLKQWLLFEAEQGDWSELASQAEFPALALNSAIKTAAKQPFGHALGCILRSLAKRALIPDSTLETITPWLCSDHSNLEKSMTALFGSSPLPDDVLEVLVGHLHHDKPIIRHYAAEALRCQPDLPEAFIHTIAERLDDDDQCMRHMLLALGQRPSLPDDVVLDVAEHLSHNDEDVREQAITTLRSLDTLPHTVLTKMEARLDDPQTYISRSAFATLCAQSYLPDDIAQAIAARFDDPTFLGYRFFSNDRPILPASVFSALVKRLDLDEWIGQLGTSRVLGSQSALSPDVLSAVALGLKNNDRFVCVKSIEILGMRPNLPEELLLNISERLHDKDDRVRYAAIRALWPRLDFPEEMRKDLLKSLNDGPEWMGALKVLFDQVTLSTEFLSWTARQLEENGTGLQDVAMTLLCRQTELPPEVLSDVAGYVKHENWWIRARSMEALSKIPVLRTDDKLYNHVVGGLDDEDLFVKIRAMEALSKCPTIPDDLLAKISTKLDKPGQIERAALTALCRQSALPETVLSALSARLYKTDSDDSELLVDILQNFPDGSIFPCILSSSHAAAIFKPLVLGSFKQPLSFYIEDDEFCFNIAEGVRRFSVERGIPDILTHIKSARPLDFPAVSGVLVEEDDEVSEVEDAEILEVEDYEIL